MKLNEAIEAFLLAGAADGLRPATLKWYRSILSQMAVWLTTHDEQGKLLPGCEEILGKKERLRLAQRESSTQVEVPPRCPSCGRADGQIKAGKLPSGSQRWKCKSCQRKYTIKAA